MIPTWVKLVSAIIEVKKKPLYMEIICKICGDLTRRVLVDIAPYNPKSGAIAYYIHDAYSHVILHKTKLTSRVEKIQLYEIKNSEFRIYLNDSINILFVDWNVSETMPQILFINCDSRELMKLHDYLRDEYLGTLEDRLKPASDVDCVIIPEYEKEMMGRNFTCLYCDDEYEGGLPSVEMVYGHLKACSRLL